MKIEVETVNPKIAEIWLTKSAGNRAITRSRVDVLAQDMAAGRWLLNAEAIKFNKADELIDGHHRLTACVESQANFRTAVARGIDASVTDTLDTGKSRTAGDVLKLHGFINYCALAAAAKHAIVYSLGKFDGSPKQARVTNAAIRREVESNPGLSAACNEVYSTYRGILSLMPPSLAVFFFWKWQRQAQSKAQEFFGILSGVVSAPTVNPAYVLREKLIQNASARKKRLRQRDLAAIVIKGWLHFRDDKPLKATQLFFREEGTGAQEFPTFE